jgi:hypothetical protein
MPTLDDVLKTLKKVKPPRLGAGHEINNISGAVTPLDVWGLLEAVRMCVDLNADYKTAIERLKTFVTNSAPMKFTKLDRAQVAMETLARVLNNSVVNQSKFGICGPAAIAMETAGTRPLEYVKLVTFLCDEGECQFRHLKLKPGPNILNYDPTGNMPQADWVVCASLRNDNDSLIEGFSKETYGGSSCEEVYNWMVKAGYTKVIGVCTVPLAHFCKTSPSSLKPPVLDPTDRVTALKIAMELSASGWQVFLGGYMSLFKSIENLKIGQNVAADPDMSEEDSQVMQKQTMEKEKAKLMTPTPGAFGRIVDVTKMVVLKKMPDDVGHWVYIESMKPCTLDQNFVTITCCTHGVRHRGVNVPLSGLINKYHGYVAVTDVY